jgi:dTDP-4-dehydrorhamnose 3,5-epimerase
MLTVAPTVLEDVKILTPGRIRDERGFFSEVFNQQRFAEAGLGVHFVQDNHSLSARTGTIRGLHFQSPPFAQDKLVRVVRGRILDVAVDLRVSSQTFGRHVAVELSAEGWQQIFVPAGFAHGFCTLAPETEVLYKTSNYYSAPHDFGLAWDDPTLGIAWPVTADQAILSDKDRRHPGLAQLPTYFA